MGNIWGGGNMDSHVALISCGVREKSIQLMKLKMDTFDILLKVVG